MIDIPLQAIANQELSIPLEGSRYVITVKEANGSMAASIERDGVAIVRNTRIVSDGFILPYRHQWLGYGNFFFSTQDENLPNFELLGVTQFIVFVTTDELEESGVI
jgi:hypothetical protein